MFSNTVNDGGKVVFADVIVILFCNYADAGLNTSMQYLRTTPFFKLCISIGQTSNGGSQIKISHAPFFIILVYHLQFRWWKSCIRRRDRDTEMCRVLAFIHKVSSPHEDFAPQNKSGSTQQLRKLKISSTHENFAKQK